MAWRPHGRASVNPADPHAFGICDRCGFLYNLRDLNWQYQWAGPRLQNLRLLVCDDCLDVPQPQLKPRILPPDPMPVYNARPENYFTDDSNWLVTVDDDILETDGGDLLVTENEANQVLPPDTFPVLGENLYFTTNDGAQIITDGGAPLVTDPGVNMTTPQPVTIDQLPSAGALTGTELVPLARLVGGNYATQYTTTNAIAGLSQTVTVILTGDVTASGTLPTIATTIATGAVSNSKLATMPANTIKGNATVGIASPTDLTGAQVTPLLSTMVGDSGTGGTKGLAPAPGAGDAAAGKYLSASGAWGVPAGTGSGTVNSVSGTASGGFTVSVTDPTLNPVVSVKSTVTGILMGDGTTVTAATSTGTGSVVLAISPTLVTPVLGAATGTSLQLSGLTASSAVATDASKNLVSVANTGTGSNVLATSPALVTPDLGTPSAAVLTNATGLPISTGVTGIGAGVAAFLATPSSANLATAVTDETGSGALVFATSPTLVTPNLGTPSAGVLTNATGLPVSTGISGLGTGVAAWLATPSSANLITAMTDETGSGSLVFANSPTLVTPALGTPSALVLTNATGLPLASGVTGTLAATRGGTGQTSFSTGDLLYASSSTAVSKLGIGTTGQVLTVSSGLPAWGPGGGTVTFVASNSLSSGATSSITSIPTSAQYLYVVVDNVAADGPTTLLLALSTNNGASYGTDRQISAGGQSIFGITCYVYNVSRVGVSKIIAPNSTYKSNDVPYLTVATEAVITGAINAIRLSTSSGIFTAGTFSVYTVG